MQIVKRLRKPRVRCFTREYSIIRSFKSKADTEAAGGERRARHRSSGARAEAEVDRNRRLFSDPRRQPGVGGARAEDMGDIAIVNSTRSRQHLANPNDMHLLRRIPRSVLLPFFLLPLSL